MTAIQVEAAAEVSGIQLLGRLTKNTMPVMTMLLQLAARTLSGAPQALLPLGDLLQHLRLLPHLKSQKRRNLFPTFLD